MKTLVIADSPLAHEEVERCWQRGDRCVVVPRGFEDPTAYVEAHRGGPGLFLYMANTRAGYDLMHVTWEQLEKRLQGETMRPFVGRVMTMFDNRWGYGLVMGRLYVTYHGGTVVPYPGSPRHAAVAIIEERVETVIGISTILADVLRDFSPPAKEELALKAILNVCRPLSGDMQRRLERHFDGAKAFNLFGLGRCGIIAISDGHGLQPAEVGNLVLPARLTEAGELQVQSPSTYPAYDLGDGWCATGKRARIDGVRLFIDGDVAVD